MMQSRTKRIIGSVLGCLVALVLAVSLFSPGRGSGRKPEGQAAKQTKAAIPAEQIVASIWAAVVAKPGNVRAVEVENEDGKTICEVEVLGQDGKTYEVEVDVPTNAVLEVEEDDDDDEDDKD